MKLLRWNSEQFCCDFATFPSLLKFSIFILAESVQSTALFCQILLRKLNQSEMNTVLTIMQSLIRTIKFIMVIIFKNKKKIFFNSVQSENINKKRKTGEKLWSSGKTWGLWGSSRGFEPLWGDYFLGNTHLDLSMDETFWNST